MTDTKKYIDWMSIGILKNRERHDFVDYIFTAAVFIDDPRFKSRSINIAEYRGLFRIHKKYFHDPALTIEDAVNKTAEDGIELLIPMEGDTTKKRFFNAAVKVLKEYQNHKNFPDKTGFQCG